MHRRYLRNLAIMLHPRPRCALAAVRTLHTLLVRSARPPGRTSPTSRRTRRSGGGLCCSRARLFAPVSPPSVPVASGGCNGTTSFDTATTRKPRLVAYTVYILAIFKVGIKPEPANVDLLGHHIQAEEDTSEQMLRESCSSRQSFPLCYHVHKYRY
ncbi:hypothetical protein DFH06DRAFT_644034 [Mycena polygramma]|nr:hypothetical protein DFH06DRAFT_644034 [Mycena polygramma]